jgi:hypothetical protein
MSKEAEAHRRADSVISLVQGACAALQIEMEAAVPGPWDDELRNVIRRELEKGIGPHVARVLTALVKGRIELGDVDV